jgi:hypothetical protein
MPPGRESPVAIDGGGSGRGKSIGTRNKSKPVQGKPVSGYRFAPAGDQQLQGSADLV